MSAKIIAAVSLAFLSATHAQPASPTFEVATVKVSLLGKAGGEKGGRDRLKVSPAGLSIQNFTLLALMEWAYNVKSFQIVAPSWCGTERYDVTAKAPGPASTQQLHEMLRTLLAERFKLTLHRENREMRVLGLEVGKGGPKLPLSAAEGACGPRMEGGRMVFQGCSMAKFADYLSHLPSLDRPVSDMTRMPGFYDFTVQFAELPAGDRLEAKHAAEEAFQDPGLGNRIAEQVGLRLETRRMPAEVLVIDHAEKVPEEN